MKIMTVAALALLATATAASAQGYRSHSIDQRQAKQEHRIEHGVRSGALTRHEARKLEAEQARIRAMERHAKRDGHVDRYEAREIKRAQNAASRHIAQESHDHQRRGLWHRRWW